MKRSMFTILLAFLFILQGAAQQVEQVQRSLLTKRAASWCPPCGGWGWAFFDSLLDDNAGKAVFFDAHYSGNLQTTVSDDLTVNFGGLYQPEFFLNENKIAVLPGNAAAMRNDVKNLVDSTYATVPVANTGFVPVYADGAINVEATVRFFQAAGGEFYLGIYLVEDHVIGFQQGQGNDADHRKILRACFSSDSWGELIASGNVSAGTEFTKQFSLPTGNPSEHDYEIAGVIWRKEGGKYHLVNVWSTTEFGDPTATAGLTALRQFEVQPNLAAGRTTVCIDMIESAADAAIDLIDLNGRVVQALFNGGLAAGHHSFTINSEAEKGLYFVRLRAGGAEAVRKVIFQ